MRSKSYQNDHYKTLIDCPAIGQDLIFWPGVGDWKKIWTFYIYWVTTCFHQLWSSLPGTGRYTGIFTRGDDQSCAGVNHLQICMIYLNFCIVQHIMWSLKPLLRREGGSADPTDPTIVNEDNEDIILWSLSNQAFWKFLSLQ